jgi:MOSC domain-containing protein YiiM
LKPAGEVVHIFVAPRRGAPMVSLAAVEALRDKGLEGDRYTVVASRHTADYQVTLIEIENIEAFARDTGLALTPEMPRRNIVTRGVRLNDLVGKRFRVGGALLEGAELCEPCTLFAKRTHREVLKGLAGRGGLRARVLEGALVRVGDVVGGEGALNLMPRGASDLRALAHHNNHPSEGT